MNDPMACTRCGKALDGDIEDPLPGGWRRSHRELYCPHCEDTDCGDVLDEELIRDPDTLDEDLEDEEGCLVCRGPCQGH
jgi:hypothetical protein